MGGGTKRTGSGGPPSGPVEQGNMSSPKKRERWARGRKKIQGRGVFFEGGRYRKQERPHRVYDQKKRGIGGRILWAVRGRDAEVVGTKWG